LSPSHFNLYTSHGLSGIGHIILPYCFIRITML